MSCCLAPITGGTNGRKTEQVLTTARDRAMQLAADVCNIPDFAWKVPASAKLKGITPSSSEECKSTQVLQAPGCHDARTAPNAALTLVFVFPVALGSRPSPSKLSSCDSHCKQGLFDT